MNQKLRTGLIALGAFVVVVVLTLTVIAIATKGENSDPVKPDSPVIPNVTSSAEPPAEKPAETKAKPPRKTTNAPKPKSKGEKPPPSFGLNSATKRKYAKMSDEERETAFIEMTADRLGEEENYLLNLRDDVCSNLAGGNSPGDVATGLQDHTGWTRADTGFFIGASVLTACPNRSSS